MAEESPVSPNSHKRRITDMVTSNDHHHPTIIVTNPTSQNPSLNPSLEVESSSLELGVSEPPESHSFPEQSPKKPKFSSLDHPLSDDTVETNSNLGDGKAEFQEKGSEIEQVGGEVGGLTSKEELECGEKNEVSEMGSEKNEEGLKQNGVIDGNSSEIGEKIGVNESVELGFEKNEVGLKQNGVIDENSSEIEGKIGVNESVELGFEKNEVGLKQNGVIDGNSSEIGGKIGVNESVELGFEKNEVGLKQNGVIDEKSGMGEKIGVNESVELGLEQNEVIDKKSSEIGGKIGVNESVELGFEKRSGNLDGVLQKLLKKEDSKGSLKIEVIDGTALVDVSLIGEMKNRRRCNNNHNNKKGSTSRNNGFVSGVKSTIECKKKCVYSRKELELLRYVNVKGQKKFWQAIYNGFSATVKKDYDEVGSFKHHRNGSSVSDNGGKKNFNDGGIMGSCSNVPYYNNRGILGESCTENVSCEAELISSPSCLHDGHNSGEDLVGEWIEDEESDDEYECIHRPAFKVEGEPDFESGPPEDGLEYLRRVRWEAKQIPKVKIAKLDNVKPKDQSVYMPEIPDIEECPPHLAPLKQWEDEFIADFSKLRLELSHHEDADDAVSTDSDSDSDSIIFARHGPKSHSPSKNSASIELTSGGPILSTVLAMDLVSRVAALRKRINLFEGASDLSKDDCAWLFALCAAIDTPLDADTSASLRCLLRHCAKLRTAKAEVDDEVIMLNVLATISGRFFGQSKF